MSDSITLDQLAANIKERLDGISDDVTSRVSDEKLSQLIRDNLNGVLADPEVIRKIRFAQDENKGQLVGTKYARWGLSPADVEWLYDFQNSMRGMPKRGGGVHSGPSEELTRTFEAISDARYMPMDKVREMDQKAIDSAFPRIPLSAFHGADRKLARAGKYELTEAYANAVRAMDTAESGFGSQLIGAQYVHDLWEAPRRLGRIAPLINTFEMTDPVAYLPVESSLPELSLVAESTDNNSANYGTTKTGSQRVQVDAKKFVIHQMWSGEMEEDSIIPFVPFLRRQAALSLAHYLDSLILNGDNTNAATGNINLDDANPADTKHYLAYDGIRHAALVDNTANAVDVDGGGTGGYTYDHFLNIKAKMLDYTNLMDWGHPVNPDDLIYACDPESADRISALDEVLTVDKYGPGATVLNGELARIAGRHPLVSTIAVPKTEADGKVSTTPANNTKGQTVVFNRRGSVMGWRRRVMVETERIPATDQTRIVYSLRNGYGRFTPSGAASGIEWAAVLYNATVAA
jgi:hypothetical protein